MSCSIGTLFRVTVFGESHSAAIGAVLDGVPAGMQIDWEEVRAAMKRRAPNRSGASTKRSEADELEILSGYVDGKTTGTPLAVLIRNTDTRSVDYLKTADLLRPGHADYTGMVKYKRANDIRGGGHFSGRLTAPLVFAGAVARQFLSQKGIAIGAHIGSIAGIADAAFPAFTKECFAELEQNPFPVVDRIAGTNMQHAIEAARMDCDSVGGVIECAVCGLPAGLGEPFFDSVESEIAHMMFSIPAVKGIEFGTGFAMAGLRGSEANDAPRLDGGKIVFETNHNGGINGGITNGMPVVFRVAVKPTASIAKPQRTVNVRTKREEILKIVGRHDACIVPRAVEVVKSACAAVLADLYLRYDAQGGSR